MRKMMSRWFVSAPPSRRIAEDDSDARYQIVGDMQADIDKLRISTSSPVARACMGKEAVTFIEVKLLAGVL